MLTKETSKLFCIMYQSYVSARNSGKSMLEARYFPSSHYLHETFFPDWNFEDVDDCCRELSRNKLITCYWADNSAWEIYISDAGINIMQKQFHDNLAKIAQAIVKGIEIIF